MKEVGSATILIYTPGLSPDRTQMIAQVRRALLYALYQMSLIVGITLLPIALVARRVGIPLPIHRLLIPLRAALDEVPAEPAP